MQSRFGMTHFLPTSEPMLCPSLRLTSLLLKLMLIRSDCVNTFAADQYASLANESRLQTEALLMCPVTKAHCCLFLLYTDTRPNGWKKYNKRGTRGTSLSFNHTTQNLCKQVLVV